LVEDFGVAFGELENHIGGHDLRCAGRINGLSGMRFPKQPPSLTLGDSPGPTGDERGTAKGVAWLQVRELCSRARLDTHVLLFRSASEPQPDFISRSARRSGPDRTRQTTSQEQYGACEPRVQPNRAPQGKETVDRLHAVPHAAW